MRWGEKGAGLGRKERIGGDSEVKKDRAEERAASNTVMAWRTGSKECG